MGETKRGRMRSVVTTDSSMQPESKSSPTPRLPATEAKLSQPTTPISKLPLGMLPPFVSMSTPKFKWGPRDGADFIVD